MREIKFRAKTKGNENMWVYGYYVYTYPNEWFKTQKNNVPKIQNAIQKAIFDRKCKQLTLF